MLPFLAIVDLVAMTMKGYSTFPESPRLETCHLIVQCHIKDTWWWWGGCYLLWRNTVGVFYSLLSQLGSFWKSINPTILSAQPTGAEEYSNCPSERSKAPPPTSVLNLILSHLMVPVLELREMLCTPSLPLLLSPLWPRVVISVRVLSMGQIEIGNYFLNMKLFRCEEIND